MKNNNSTRSKRQRERERNTKNAAMLGLKGGHEINTTKVSQKLLENVQKKCKEQ